MYTCSMDLTIENNLGVFQSENEQDPISDALSAFLMLYFSMLIINIWSLVHNYSFSVCLGMKKVFHKEVSSITNKRLDDTLQEALPPHYKKHDILFLCGNYVGPTEMSPRYNDLSINWCIGDKDIEVLDGTKGLIVDG